MFVVASILEIKGRCLLLSGRSCHFSKGGRTLNIILLLCALNSFSGNDDEAEDALMMGICAKTAEMSPTMVRCDAMRRFRGGRILPFRI